MRVLMIPLANVDIVSVGMFVKVGSRYESDDNNGISHFLEHLMFKGTKKYPGNKLFHTLDNSGARYNAETSYEYTYYYIYGHGDNLDVYLDVLLDIYENPTFRDEDIKTERKVVFEEMNMYKNDIDDFLHNKIHSTMFTNSPLKLPILGTRKTLKQINRKEITRFRKRYYTPDRTVLVICGSFDKDKAFEKYKNQLDSIKSCSCDIYIPIADPPIQTEKHLYKWIDKGTVPSAAICYRSSSFFSKYADHYDILSDILTSGSSSRLFTLLREKMGVAYNVESENITYHYEGLFCIYLSSDRKHFSKAIDALLNEIAQLVDKGIKEEELEKAKKIRISSLMLNLQTPTDLMSYHGINEVYYRIGNIDVDKQYRTKISGRIENILAVKVDDINNLIKDLFSQEKLNIFVAGDSKYKMK
jgi:predicted Zn-dependent peptidase